MKPVTIHGTDFKLAALATKKQILEDAGYRYSFGREVYFNQKAKKAFSVDFIEDHSEAQLEQRIREKTPETEWHFFFNSLPSEAAKGELATALNNAQPHR